MFDSEFDKLMTCADDYVYSTMGERVRVNDSEPFLAIYDERANEFDAMSGVLKKLTFRRGESVRIRKGDQVEFTSSGKKLTVTSGPYHDNGEVVVYL
ncbi:head-tail joining protein [Vibrio cholerae]|uniref:head-tail joining protein n=1 Tax=Gammaproteobacteria TaxID=1236 RepID=UPI001E3AB208|nr:head-tail joining protein [Vibrio cholerae]MCD1245832.1 hypothetical protein [Vibrio cholerae]